MAACGGGGDGGGTGGTGATAADAEPAAAVTTNTTSSTQLGAAPGTGLVAKRLEALECGARVETRHSDHAATFGTSTKARMQMPEDCVPKRSVQVATKVLKDMN